MSPVHARRGPNCVLSCARVVVLALSSVVAVVGPVAGQVQTTERVSTSGALQPGTGNGFSMSSDGRFVAFDSFASTFVPNDTNGVTDVFVKDRLTNQIERVSVG